MFISSIVNREEVRSLHRQSGIDDKIRYGHDDGERFAIWSSTVNCCEGMFQCMF
jgi:hypothetical protein